MSFIYDKYKYAEADFPKQMSDVLTAVKVYVFYRKNQKHQILYIHSDRDSGYFDRELLEFCKVECIVHQFASTHSHKSTGVA